MAFYSALDVPPTWDERIPDYLPAANERIAAHGGTRIARTASQEQVEGDAQEAGLRIVIEWPSKDAAQAFMADEGYAPTLPHALPARSAITI
jgi:uncharacterized protein (DUF1330 family)